LVKNLELSDIFPIFAADKSFFLLTKTNNYEKANDDCRHDADEHGRICTERSRSGNSETNGWC
jgi:hypothetical protein